MLHNLCYAFFFHVKHKLIYFIRRRLINFPSFSHQEEICDERYDELRTMSRSMMGSFTECTLLLIFKCRITGVPMEKND